MALDLAQHGFDIAVHYRHSQADALATVNELNALGAAAHAFAADLSNEAECRALVPAVVAHFKRLDAVVNSAGVFEHDDPASFSVAAMELHWRVNTAPAVLLAQALHAHLAGCSEVGCVVNLLDKKLWNPNPDYFSYTLSKAALQAATVMLAQALAPQVRVCGVAPGVTPAVGPNEQRRVHGGAHDDAAATLVYAGRHRPRGAFSDRVTGHHRHELAGRWRPASERSSARCDVPRQEPLIDSRFVFESPPRLTKDTPNTHQRSRCKASSATPA